MAKKILIAGGSGLIGTKLTSLLIQRGYQVAHLGRSPREGKVMTYGWDPDKGTYDPKCLDEVSVVINLAGAGVAEKRWTDDRKKVIKKSRVKSVALLTEMVKNSQADTVIGASAIGYYGFSNDKVLEENDSAGSDFLAQVTKAWEEAYSGIKDQGKRVVNFRIGIVLAKEGGALQEIAKPIRYFVGAPLGVGNQIMSWIHIDDLCEMFLCAIEKDALQGVYNAVAPNPVSNRELTKAVAKEMNRPIMIPFVPGFVLKIMLGEMSDIVLNGSIVSSKKIQATGFTFSFEKLSTALKDLC